MYKGKVRPPKASLSPFYLKPLISIVIKYFHVLIVVVAYYLLYIEREYIRPQTPINRLRGDGTPLTSRRGAGATTFTTFIAFTAFAAFAACGVPSKTEGKSL